MTLPLGWWLACPYFEPDAHIIRLYGGAAAYPARGPRVFQGAFLGPEWVKFHDPSGLIARTVERLLPNARLALTWQLEPGVPKPEAVRQKLVERGFACLEDDIVGKDTVFQVYELLEQRVGLSRPWRKPDNACLVMRFGAFGDHLMAASVLPALKAEGWHVTYMGPPAAVSVLKHDPNVDAFLVYNQELVPESEALVFYIDAWAQRFDRFVNLNASVERALLYRPDQIEYYRDDTTRRRLCNGNYLEYVHHVAGVPYEPRQRFYPSLEEADRAAQFARDNAPLVMMAIAGSAEHKIWPHAPQAAARLLAQTNCKLAIVGGERDIGLSTEITKHVTTWLGKDSERLIDMTSADIRDTMAVARECAVVIGPETGVLNAVAFEESVGKVVLLSHSTETNLTRDWLRTISLSGDVPCYPCHRLHGTLRYCPRGPSGKRAACAEAIGPDAVVEAAKHLLGQARPGRVVSLAAAG